MKHILLILSLFGLTACSKKQVKNNTAEEIYAAGSLVAAGGCEPVTSGWFGDFPLMFHKVTADADGGKEQGDHIGKEEGYSEVSHYVVNNTSQDAGAVTTVDEDPCESPAAGGGDGDANTEELNAAKQAAVDAASAAKQAADSAVAKTQQVVNDLSTTYSSTSKQTDLGPAAKQKLAEAQAVQAEAVTVVEEANAVDTVEKANAVKTKAEAIKAKAEAI